MNEFYANIDPTTENYLVVTPEPFHGRIHIKLQPMTVEMAEGLDYSDANAVDALSVGESVTINGGCNFVLRVY